MLLRVVMHIFTEKGEGGDLTHTCDPEHPPPTVWGWHALAVSAQADGGFIDVPLGVHVPPCTSGSVAVTDPVFEHALATHSERGSSSSLHAVAQPVSE